MDNNGMDLNKIVSKLKALNLKELEALCDKHGVPYSTALKVRNGHSKNPRYSTTEMLWKAVK